MAFHAIHPGDLRDVWGAVRSGLEKMPASDWIPEDVYHYIKSGHCALFMHTEGKGFLVIRRLVAEFSGDVICHVWLAYNAGGESEYEEAVEFYRSVAKSMGASRITFSSPRKGWSKRFNIIETIYEVSL